MDTVKDTWKQLGFKIKARTFYLFVRTHPIPKKIDIGEGKFLWLPPKLQSFYGDIRQVVSATVLAAGPRSKGIKEGDTVVFERLHFASLYKLNLDEHVGYIDTNQLMGIGEDDGREGYSFAS